MGDITMESDYVLGSDQVIHDPAESMQIAEPDINRQSNEEQVVYNAGAVEFQHPALFSSQTLIELCSSSWSRSSKARADVQPYLRGCKWSPDGTCCLSVVNNDGVHVTELPRDLYAGTVRTDRIIDVLDSVIHVKECSLVYDFCWYPNMNSLVPESCCWLTTRQNAPIQMWDAFDGSLRCSYRGFNAVDEVEPAICVTFSCDGAQIIAGYKKHFRTFDVNRPGRDFLEHKISSPSSCLTTSQNLLASGSWNTSVSLYSTEQGTYKSIGKMHGHSGGVTHMKFTPDGTKLVTGARKDHRLLVWDIRYYRRPLNILSRAVDTNQRVYFDISPCGKYLVTGGTDGIIKVWDVDKVNWKDSLDVLDVKSDNATYMFPLHRDCCNSVSIHPYHPIIATGSGQLHIKDPIEDSSPDEPKNEDFEQNGSTLNGTDPNSHMDLKYSLQAENSLVFWWTADVMDPEGDPEGIDTNVTDRSNIDL